MRAANALTISLVAEIEGQIVGHIAFSPVTVSDGATGWYGLGPVSVSPHHQRQGIGKALINEGLSLLKEIGSQGCALVGNPNYYQWFGFKNYPELVHEEIPLLQKSWHHMDVIVSIKWGTDFILMVREIF